MQISISHTKDPVLEIVRPDISNGKKRWQNKIVAGIIKLREIEIDKG